jgi:leucyl-tRNA synthetase
MLNPFAPHITSEIFEAVFGSDIMYETFPDYDESKIVVSTIQLPVQLNGKTKGTITVGVEIAEDEATSLALEFLGKSADGVKKVIYRPGQIINVISM